MNKSVYIFGRSAGGHAQWPDDSSSEILTRFYGRCKAPTQIIVHRDRAMMYYGYVRQLDGGEYIGLCVAMNGCYVKSVDSMFAIYEKAIERMAEKGVFVRFTDKGELVSGTSSFASEAEEVDTLTHRVGLDFDALDDGQPSQLPPTDYTNSKDSVKFFSISDDMRDIVRATYTYSYTFIYKEQDFNTVRMDSYKSMLVHLNKELAIQKEFYEAKLWKLNAENERLKESMNNLKVAFDTIRLRETQSYQKPVSEPKERVYKAENESQKVQDGNQEEKKASATPVSDTNFTVIGIIFFTVVYCVLMMATCSH